MLLSVLHVRDMLYTAKCCSFTYYLVESPAKKWPNVFANIPLLANYPYLLPCAIASCITLIGEQAPFDCPAH